MLLVRTLLKPLFPPLSPCKFLGQGLGLGAMASSTTKNDRLWVGLRRLVSLNKKKGPGGGGGIRLPTSHAFCMFSAIIL